MLSNSEVGRGLGLEPVETPPGRRGPLKSSSGLRHWISMTLRGTVPSMYDRILDLASLLRHRSLFLLGPRQTGKSTLLRLRFPQARYVDLLEADTFRRMSAYPETLRQSLTGREQVLAIDEIQKLPGLLDEVQAIIDRNKRLRVVLTGSSARKLRRSGTNLLAGRAWVCRLHPLVSAELPETPLLRRLSYGGLPAILDSAEPLEDLRAYVG